MKKLCKHLSVILVFAIILSSIQPGIALAASKKYVRSLTLSKKTMSISAGKSKSFTCKVKVKGKASKAVTVKASNSNVKVTVNKKGTVRVSAKKAGTSKITVTTKGKNKKGKRIKKTVKVTVVAARKSTAVAVTKSQWISAVMDATGYSEQKELFDFDEEGKVAYSFTDISNDENADLIETAVKYGIIPASGGKFNPKSAASREFLAVTSVRAIGLITDETTISCTDKAALKYEAEDATAVKLGLIKLSKNSFFPNGAVTKEEMKTAVAILADILESRKVDENHKDVIEYGDDVKVKDDVTDYTVQEKNDTYTVTVPNDSALDDVSAGDKVMLPETDSYPDGMALIVDSNTLSADGENRMLTGTVPENILEFIDVVDIEGTAMADADAITAVSGVSTVKVTAEGKVDSQSNLKTLKEGAVDFGDELKVSYTIDELDTTVSFWLTELKYKLDFNKKEVKELYIGMPNVLSVDTDYKVSRNFSEKLGEIPIDLPAGFSVNVEVWLEAGINGEITLHFCLSNQIGMQYYNGEFFLEKSCEPSLEAKADADLDVGAKFQLGLYWMKGILEIFHKEDSRPVYNVYTKWGLHGDATLQTRNDKYTAYETLICVDLGYYLYGKVSVGDGSFLGDEFDLKKDWTIFDGQNSPLQDAVHIENGTIVGFCTYKAVEEDEGKIQEGLYIVPDTQNILYVELDGDEIYFFAEWVDQDTQDITTLEEFAELDGNDAKFVCSDEGSVQTSGKIHFENSRAILTLDENIPSYIDEKTEYSWLRRDMWKLSEEQLNNIKKDLNVPDSLDVQIKQYDPDYWAVGGCYLTYVEICHNDNVVAFASVDSYTGKLARNIYNYTP